MEFSELIKARYSCKKYDGRPVDPAQLKQILEAGRLAPTAKNLQEQKIYVIQKPEDLAKVDELTPCRYGAGTVLLVAYDRNSVYTYPGDQYTSGVEDAAIVATHMLLAAKDAGVDSCWLNRFDPDKAAELFGLPDNEKVVMLLDLGYPAEGAGPLERHNQRKDLDETVKYL
ncbi:MAG: nitroreductase family protein [Pseudoramibacter sp.]